jgi:hypothetical protein
MVELSKIRVDPAAESAGRWMPWRHGIQLLIARMDKPRVQERMRELAQPNLEAIREGDVEAIRAVNLAVISELVLLGWKGIEDNGEPLPYSTEKANDLLSDPGLADMYEFVLISSNGRNKFLVEDSKGN